MSIESAKAFLERVKNDEDFRKELEGHASVEGRKKFAKAQGFDFTEEEGREVRESLGEDELEAISAAGFEEFAKRMMSLPGCKDEM